jgi:hypothetical protein
MTDATPTTSNAASPEQFARVHGSPGEAPRSLGLFLMIWPFLLVFLLLGYLIRALWPYPDMSHMAIGVALLGLAGLLAWFVSGGRARWELYIKGARGEEWVARTLAFLPASYSVYHGVRHAGPPLLGAGGDYDHIVVGPTGVFLVETKNWSGNIRVQDGRIVYDGREPSRPPLEQVKDAAARLRQELRDQASVDVEVKPVLCFVHGRLPGGQTGVGGVLICSGRALREVLLETPEQVLGKAAREKMEFCLNQRMEESL